jgi:hypothetical protein
VPAQADVEILGDSLYTTQLFYSGAGSAPVLELYGPSRARLGSFRIDGRNQAASLVRIDRADQAGGQIRMENSAIGQWHGALDHALVVDRLAESNVDLYVVDLAAYSGTPLQVYGAGGAGRVALYNSAPGVETVTAGIPLVEVFDGARLTLFDTWYEGPSARVLQLGPQHAGNLLFWNFNMSVHEWDGTPLAPFVEVDGFHGQLGILTTILNPFGHAERNLQVLSEAGDTQVLCLGLEAFYDQMEGVPPYFYRNGSGGQVSFAHSSWMRNGEGQFPIDDVGDVVSDGALQQLFDNARAAAPHPPASVPWEATDVRIHQLSATGASVGIFVTTD